MKNLTKSILGAMAIASSFAGTAYAQDSDFAVSASVAVQSDYRFRGISQNNTEVAPQASLTVSGPEGFYVGAWASKTNWLLNQPGSPSFELDLTFGKNTDLFGFANLNTYILYYAYPDAKTPGVALKNASFFEITNIVSRSWGPFSTSFTWAYTPNFSLGGGTGNYISGNLSVPLNDWLTASGTVGHQWVSAAKLFGSRDYTHFDIGATATYRSLALDLRYVDTDLSSAQCSAFWMATTDACGGTVMATLTYNISSFPW
jgi:uncharacterized protein (TIGR02001 family)